ncbi:MAG: hypothetical protein Q8S32_13160 [Burkholderiaceae bacterium]|nr:hypothetical protein [Burkholderiaceae bacterium]
MQDKTVQKTPDIYKPSSKERQTLGAEFALFGLELTRSIRADDGVITYMVRRHAAARFFSCWSDILAYRASLGGKP